MGNHLREDHGFTEEDARRRMRAATGGGLRKFGIQLSRPPLSAQQQDEYTSLLAIAMANQLVPLSTFDKKPQKHIAVVGQEDRCSFC